jgi:glycosyltransferase involved in cell wall biosynthesis
MVYLSIVIAVYNEEKNICPLIDRIYQELGNYEMEIIFVDDGSTDATAEEIRQMTGTVVKLIRLNKNYGQSAALSAGIDHATGDYIVTMDGDLQNDPADIAHMLTKLKSEKLDLVVGIRKERKDKYLLRKVPSRFANAFIGAVTKTKIKDNGCALKVFTSEMAKSIDLYGELHRFIPLMASLHGAKIGEIHVQHHSRKNGKSKYGLSRIFKVLSDLLLMIFMKKYLNKPMHLFGKSGLLLSGIGLLINIYLLGLKIGGQDIWGKPLLILGVLLLIAGFQLVTTGVIAELLMRTYYESQNKKQYSVRSYYGDFSNSFFIQLN